MSANGEIKLSNKQCNEGPESVQDPSRCTVLRGLAAAGVTILVSCKCLAETKNNNQIDGAPQATGRPEGTQRRQIYPLPSVFPIPCLRKRPLTSCVTIPPICFLITQSGPAYLVAAEQGRQRELRFDPESLHVAAAFQDFGPIKKFSSPDERTE